MGNVKMANHLIYLHGHTVVVSLAEAYHKVVDVVGGGKRLLGKYFRVAFFGQVNGL